MVARQFVRLEKSAPVIVQDRWADRLVSAIEQHRAMHLAREADRFQRAQRLARAASEVGDRAGHRVRPVVGILLRPAGARTVGRIGPGGARDRLRRPRRSEAP